MNGNQNMVQKHKDEENYIEDEEEDSSEIDSKFKAAMFPYY